MTQTNPTWWLCGWWRKGSPLMTFPTPILVTKGFLRSTEESNLNKQQRSARAARAGDVRGEGCVSVLGAVQKSTGVVNRHFITFLWEVNPVARTEGFQFNAHYCCCGWEKGFLTEVGDKKIEVGSNWMIQFCEVGGWGDNGDRQAFLDVCCGGGGWFI